MFVITQRGGEKRIQRDPQGKRIWTEKGRKGSGHVEGVGKLTTTLSRKGAARRLFREEKSGRKKKSINGSRTPKVAGLQRRNSAPEENPTGPSDTANQTLMPIAVRGNIPPSVAQRRKKVTRRKGERESPPAHRSSACIDLWSEVERRGSRAWRKLPKGGGGEWPGPTRGPERRDFLLVGGRRRIREGTYALRLEAGDAVG